ncbi:metal-dependent hydrolase [Alteromonas sp. ASW11-130]|uniref:metal-dependent hydrolase n=1 Tax=Alteromonas sp. ASW11-130 TaxID=3015775 RepID=UPI00224273B6|nr:metal-dependent hydrolase [Alteromonas sp. ASW11-130]MCW8090916.1 metal-dependent hydrolase [Alteromonas sp. ASW11-130]
MDPVSQGVLGAAAAIIVAKNKHKLRQAAMVGGAAGMAPDLDILFQSSHDPLLALELHRQFTHSLVFIPFGALIVATLFWLLIFRKETVKSIYLYSIAGYATHGLLDSCTSYGTQLLWPFTHLRVAWDSIGIIDPFVTLPLLIGLVMACVSKTKAWIYVAVLIFFTYMGLGVVQHHRAINVVENLVMTDFPRPQRIRALPSIGNVIVWRTLHEAGEKYFINAVAVPLFGEVRLYDGRVVDKLKMQYHFPEIKPDSVQFNDVSRFRWFTDNWLAVDPQHPDRIIDLRYSTQVEGIQPLWAIQLDSDKQHHHVKFIRNTSTIKSDIVPFDKIFGATFFY